MLRSRTNRRPTNHPIMWRWEATSWLILRFKEAYAETRCETEQASVTAAAAARFCDDPSVLDRSATGQFPGGLWHHVLVLAADALFRRVGPARQWPRAPIRRQISSTNARCLIGNVKRLA